MRPLQTLTGLALLVVGLSLAVAVLYDATELTRLAGLSPASGEAAIALGGLAAAGLAIGFGVRALRRAAPAAG